MRTSLPPQEAQCQGTCILGKKDKPVRIGALERFVADWERENGVEAPEVAPATGKRVAVVGSGPAGITAATECLRAGHEVTIFESLHEAGGVLTYGIPAFRMPKDIVQFEIKQVLGLGAELRLNHIVGRSVPVDELLAYDAVFIGTGAGLPYFMGIEGENFSGVYSANEFLTRVNLMHADRFPEFDTPIIRGSRVAVIGGGNVAMDSARVARRLGAQVYLIYRRREEDLPAREEEVANAIQEGVEFVCCANRRRFWVVRKCRVSSAPAWICASVTRAVGPFPVPARERTVRSLLMLMLSLKPSVRARTRFSQD